MKTVTESPPTVDEREFITAISTALPACRMAVLFIDRTFGPVEISHSPVVAIETTIRHFWYRRDPDGRPDHREYSNEAALRAAGYKFHHREIVHTPLIVTEYGHIVSLTELRPESDTCQIVVKVCDWPPAEDDEQFDAMAATIGNVLLAASSQSAATVPVSITVAVAKPAIDKPATAAAAKTGQTGQRC